MSKVSFMLREKKLPLETQTKVKRYLEFVWKQEQKEDPVHENFIMNKLSSELRNEIYLHTNVQYLKKVSAFKKFSEKTLIMLAGCLKKVCFCPEEFIYKEKEGENLNIYFVLDGNLKLVSARDDKVMTVWRKFKKGDYFGEIEIFSGYPHSQGVVSVDFSTLFKLSRSDFIKVLKKIPTEYEKFCEMKDQTILYNKLNRFDKPCFSCGYNDHPLEKCDFLSYNPNKKVIIHKYLSKQRVKAKNFQRKNLLLTNALRDKSSSNFAILEFLAIYQDDEDLKYLVDLYSQEEEYRSTFIQKESDLKDEKEMLDSTFSCKEIQAVEKNRELAISRWRRKSVRAFSKPIIEKPQMDESVIKRSAIISEEFSSINEKQHHDENSRSSSADEINKESNEDFYKPKRDKTPLNIHVEWNDSIKDQTQKVEKHNKHIGLPRRMVTSSLELDKKGSENIKMKYCQQDSSKFTNSFQKVQIPGPKPVNPYTSKLDMVKVFESYFSHNNITELLKKFKKRKSLSSTKLRDKK